MGEFKAFMTEGLDVADMQSGKDAPCRPRRRCSGTSAAWTSAGRDRREGARRRAALAHTKRFNAKAPYEKVKIRILITLRSGRRWWMF